MGNQFVLHHKRKPIPHHIVYNKIKEGGQDKTSLGCPPSCLEVEIVVPVLTGNNLLPLPKFFQ